MSNFININQLSLDSDSRSLLYNLELTIQKGSVTAIYGADGDGKEALLDILAGKTAPSSGSISLEDKPYRPDHTAAALKAGVIHISENAQLAPDLTVKESLTLGLRNTPKADEITQALKKLKLDNLKGSTLCKELTESEATMLLLARALISNAKLCLFSKTDNALSKEERNQYFSVIRDLKSRGTAVIMIPAIAEEMQFTDNLYVLSAGQLKEASGNIDSITADIYSDEEGSIFPSPTESRSNTIIMESLALKGKRLKDASINIRKGEICGITGLRGSGIEELIAILKGRSSSSGGVLSANSNNLQVKRMSPTKREKAGISIFNGKLNSELDYDSRCTALRALSGSILVLLDPAYGLEVKKRRNFYRLINELKSDNKAIMLFTSSIEELKGISDTIAIMHNGELSATRSKDNWTDEEIYKYVTSGKLEAFSIL